MNKYFAYLGYDFSDISDIRLTAEIRKNCKHETDIISNSFETSKSFISRLKSIYPNLEYEFNIDVE